MMKSKAWLPYVIPMGIYMAFLLVQTNANLLWLYPAKVVAVAAALVYFRKEYEELYSPMICRAGAPLANASRSTTAGGAPALQLWLVAIIVGLVAIAIWIGIDPFY